MGSMSVIGLGLSATAREPSQAQLAQKAKILRSETEHIALAMVPNGRVKSAEIENETRICSARGTDDRSFEDHVSD
jgi:hypothetical protein